ncbi:xanthine dehydrogenase family protein molybdopterin-binding subunit [Burkholderia sp. Bp8992]|uniref:xanthine dehydrogenase family protein molybdopterin-binding subunit n=1 Tax=unclassified Burkholderia TaxID=2613784 RepID=UPI000F562C6F|nr:xanthine dehydrogenase family protein molybdopterin-binding subunit [Burkholderia sp. Bp8992]RQR42780.1 xanthine dehydrogenase family protein molybdopterin-binding subunit [Burkholderia sp. Bp9131]RQS33730.1 xanthine dehydrogenase family protein molybdopterin-binding subunit [Burkholderia sp. Bp8992]
MSKPHRDPGTPPDADVGTDERPRGGFVGQPVRRFEDARLLTGLGRYVDDRPAGNALHLAIVRSDQAHARIRAVRADAARGMEGVFGIYAWADLAGLVKPAVAVSRMADYQPTPIHALADGVVHFVGEPVIAVLADSRYLAEDARDAIEIEYEPLPVETDAEAAAQPSAPLLHEGLTSNVLVERRFVRGEIDEAFANAPVTVGGRFRFHRKMPTAMEPRTYIAEVDPGRDALTLYTSSQIPGIVRDAMADLLDMPGNRLTVIAPDVGGGFGGKTSVYQEEVLVCVLARKIGRAVRWSGDRLEDMLSTSQAFDERVDAELALDSDGRILGLRAEVIGDVGAYSIYPWTAGIEPVQVISFLPGPYRVPAYHGHVRGVTTPKAPTGPYRGVGRPTSTFAMERLMDLAAKRLDMDPTELRLRNLVRPEEFPYRTPVGIVWDQSAFIEGIEAAKERFDYTAARQAQAHARAEGRWVGIGVACYAELSGIGSRISASPGMPINTGTDTCVIQLDSTGAVTASFGCASHGQGHETTLAQVLADELGARIEDLRVITGNSAAVPHGTGSYASRTAVISSGAGMLAARELRARMLRVAGHLLDVSPGDLDVVESVIRVRWRDACLSFADLAKALYSQMGRVPPEFREDLCVSRVYDPVVGTTSSSTHLVQVEIDPETYGVHVQQYVIAEDCGRVINPLIVAGQTRGAVAQGIGAALLEEVVYDAEGQLLTASLVDYLLPSAPEVPTLDLVHLEKLAPNTLGGFRGMGEGGTIGSPAAIANAIADALSPLDVDISELPVTPERLYRLIHLSPIESIKEQQDGIQT